MKLRRFRISAAGVLVAATAAAVTVAVIVVPANGSQRAKIHDAAAPSQASLSSYASAHGGKHVAGPVADGSHYVGAYATKQAIVVVKYTSRHWRADGDPITKFGPGKFVRRLSDAGDVVSGHAAFAVRIIGGDVSYFGGVLYDAGGTWRAARFAKCAGHKNLSCAYSGDSEPYGHVVQGSFESTHNNCTPNCAAGTDYVVTWKWSAARSRFVVASVVKYRVYHVG